MHAHTYVHTHIHTQRFTWGRLETVGSVRSKRQRKGQPDIEQWMGTFGRWLKLNSDTTEAILVGSCRKVSVSQDSHLRVANHGISFKGHIRNLGVYIYPTVSMVKHIYHSNCSAPLTVRTISSVGHLLMTKATAQLMCSFVLSLLDYCTLT